MAELFYSFQIANASYELNYVPRNQHSLYESRRFLPNGNIYTLTRFPYGQTKEPKLIAVFIGDECKIENTPDAPQCVYVISKKYDNSLISLIAIKKSLQFLNNHIDTENIMINGSTFDADFSCKIHIEDKLYELRNVTKQFKNHKALKSLTRGSLYILFKVDAKTKKMVSIFVGDECRVEWINEWTDIFVPYKTDVNSPEDLIAIKKAEQCLDGKAIAKKIARSKDKWVSTAEFLCRIKIYGEHYELRNVTKNFENHKALESLQRGKLYMLFKLESKNNPQKKVIACFIGARGVAEKTSQRGESIVLHQTYSTEPIDKIAIERASEELETKII